MVFQRERYLLILVLLAGVDDKLHSSPAGVNSVRLRCCEARLCTPDMKTWLVRPRAIWLAV